MIIILWILFIGLFCLWNLVGLIASVEKFEFGEFPKGIEHNFYFHLKGGPVSWFIGIGRLMYYYLSEETIDYFK